MISQEYNADQIRYQKSVRAKRGKGICSSMGCWEPCAKNRSRCEKHVKEHAFTERVRRKRLKEKRLCQRCRAPLRTTNKRTICEECAAKMVKYTAEHVRPMRKEQRRCTHCGRPLSILDVFWGTQCCDLCILDKERRNAR